MTVNSGSRAFAGIELGGTKVLCRVVDEAGNTLGEGRFATSSPAKAVDDVGRCVEAALAQGHALAGVGVASFGPIIVDPADANYGHVLSTPKPGWSGFDLHGALRDRLHCAVHIDTDVNAAALAEQQRGAGQGAACVAYVTVGTGIGGGLASTAGMFRGCLHPEVGHVRLRRREGDTQQSSCPFHADCAEGLAAGPAIAARLGGDVSTFANAPQVRELIAGYLGDLMATLVLAWAPHRIVVGGGVLATDGLLDQIAKAMRDALAGYGPTQPNDAGYLVAAQLDDAGLEGALILARQGA